MSQPAQRRIDEIGDESRRRIMDAAEQLFAERGFEKTSFVDISSLSGISRGSIPWHFKNKDGLVMAVVERAIGRTTPDDYAGLPTMAEVVEDFADSLHAAYPKMLFMILTEAMNSTGSLHEQYQRFLDGRRLELQQWVRAQRPGGVDRTMATEREKALAAVLNAALIGIQLQWQIDPDRVDLGSSLRMLASLVDNHLAELYEASFSPTAKPKRVAGKKVAPKVKPA